MAPGFGVDANEVLRPDPEVAKSAPEYATATMQYTPLALDSQYDYDPYAYSGKL